MVRHRFALLVGLGGMVAGVAVAVGVLGIEAPSSAVLAVGLVAVLATVGVGIAGRRPGDWPPTPRPDAAELPATPGAEIDAAIESSRVDNQTKVQGRLRRLAIGALRHRDDLPEHLAAERLKRREWTDDIGVAEFLEDDGYLRPDTDQRLFGTSGRDTRWSPDGFTALVERTVAVIGELGERFGVDRDNVPPEEDRPFEKADRIPPEAMDWPTLDADPGRVVLLESGTADTWRFAVGVAIAFLGIGLVLQRPALLAPGVVAAAFAAFGRVTRPPTPDLQIEREINDETPAPGDSCRVTLTVTNTGERTIPELQIFDGVPAALPAGDGCARVTALRPGETATLRYRMAARHGTHRFRPVYLRCRDLAGSYHREVAVSVPATIECLPTDPGNATAPRLAPRANDFVGQLPTATGSGIEFAERREYRPGDPLKRIDWNRLAAGQELATVEFVEERSTTAVVGIDVRVGADVAPAPGCESAMERCLDAGLVLGAGLLAANNAVGFVGIGPDPTWIPAASGRDAIERARLTIGADRSFTVPPVIGPTDTVAWVNALRERYPAATQVVLCTPLCDATVGYLARRLSAFGYPVTIVSPDPTIRTTTGERIVAIDRHLWIARLRSHGIRVVDWAWTEPLAVAIERAASRPGGR